MQLEALTKDNKDNKAQKCTKTDAEKKNYKEMRRTLDALWPLSSDNPFVNPF